MKPLTEPRRRFTLRDLGRLPSLSRNQQRGRRDGVGPQRSRRESLRGRAALAAVVAGCVAVTGVAVAGAGNAASGVRFDQPGRYIYNSTIGAVLHVNGDTLAVDSQVPLPGVGPGAQVVESDRNGYVLSRGRTFQFGKSDLEVADPEPAPPDEQPIGLEAGGAAFAVYQRSGRVVRFDHRPTVVSIGTALGSPVVTAAGTVWVHRSDTGQLCRLPLDADRLSCPAKVPSGHSGSLALVGTEQVVFVDTTARDLYAVGDDGLGRRQPLPVKDLPADALVAGNDLDGRVALVDRRARVVHLVDTGQLISGRDDAEPIRRQLPQGDYQRVASSGRVLALVDDTSDTLLTFGADGEQQSTRRIPPPSAKAKVGPQARSGLYRGGDSRLYVASRSGEQVMVVDDSGEVTSVDTGTGRPSVTKPGEPTGKPVRPSTPPPSLPPTPPPSVRPTPPPSVRPTPPLTERKPTPPPSVRPDEPDRPTEEKPTPPPSVRPDKPDRPIEQPTRKPPPKAVVRASKPGAPRSVSGRAGNGLVDLSWGAAAANGSAITAYQVTWNGGSRTLAASDRSVRVAGLTNRTGYAFTVRAVNAAGPGPGSTTGRLVPTGTVPDAPSGFGFSVDGDSVSLVWKQPNLRGNTFVGYVVRATAKSQNKSSTSSGTGWTFDGLKAGETYSLSVRVQATDPSGATVWGRTVSRTVTLGSDAAPPRLTASRGASTTYGSGQQSCLPPGCAFVRIVGTGLKPNTDYNFVPNTTQWQPSNPGVTLRTDARGTITIEDRFPTDAPGQQVWVVAQAAGEDPITSDKFTWTRS